MWLIWTAEVSGNQDTSLVRKRVSRDNGASWAPVEALFGAPAAFDIPGDLTARICKRAG